MDFGQEQEGTSFPQKKVTNNRVMLLKPWQVNVVITSTQGDRFGMLVTWCHSFLCDWSFCGTPPAVIRSPFYSLHNKLVLLYLHVDPVKTYHKETMMHPRYTLQLPVANLVPHDHKFWLIFCVCPDFSWSNVQWYEITWPTRKKLNPNT